MTLILVGWCWSLSHAAFLSFVLSIASCINILINYSTNDCNNVMIKMLMKFLWTGLSYLQERPFLIRFRLAVMMMIMIMVIMITPTMMMMIWTGLSYLQGRSPQIPFRSLLKFSNIFQPTNQLTYLPTHLPFYIIILLGIFLMEITLYIIPRVW